MKNSTSLQEHCRSATTNQEVARQRSEELKMIIILHVHCFIVRAFYMYSCTRTQVLCTYLLLSA